MRTWLTETFAITVPVVSAPMAGVAGGELAAAVSRAGGLGMIGVGAGSTPEWVREQAEIAAAGPTPYGIGLQAWVQAIRPGQLEVVLELRPALVSISYGPYADYLPRLHEAGLIVATTAGTLAEARAAEDAGVDVIIARGAEGGGHGRNQVATLPLVQSVLDAVSVPVLASGGIGSARGLAAVLAAGAAGAWVGTAFLTCIEGTSSPAARRRLIEATDTDTVYGQVFDIGVRAGWPREWGERALRNSFYDNWIGREDELATDSAAAREMALARDRDDIEIACVDAGQGVALLQRESTAADVVGEFAGAQEHLRRAASGADPH